VEIEIERTFLQYRLANNDSDAPTLVVSAPCGEAESPQPTNPRRSQIQ
jgi:hypothetical protein